VMRWGFKRRQARVPLEALRARQQAEQQLEDVRSQDVEIDEVTDRLARHLEENHIAEALMASMAPRKRRRLRHS
jgi:hypothetical protein